jgi:uncharacterized membrane protein YedE/YeeE
MRAVSAFAAGLAFGIGLWLSGLADRRKVLAFLDVAGAWDPSLLFVMAGAVAVALAGYRWALKRKAPLLEPRYDWPPRKEIDAPLLAGAALFGLGWGITGYCPGPALTSLATLDFVPLVFVAAMMAGGLLSARLRR